MPKSVRRRDERSLTRTNRSRARLCVRADSHKKTAASHPVHVLPAQRSLFAVSVRRRTAPSLKGEFSAFDTTPKRSGKDYSRTFGGTDIFSSRPCLGVSAQRSASDII